jgi:hypothetical protein
MGGKTFLPAAADGTKRNLLGGEFTLLSAGFQHVF